MKTTSSSMVDFVLEATGSKAYRVFWSIVGRDVSRRAAAKAAWDALDPFLLPEELFKTDFDLLMKCLNEERAHRHAPTVLPSSAEVETLPPSAAAPPPQNHQKAVVVETDDLFTQEAAAGLAPHPLPTKKPQKTAVIDTDDFFARKAREAKATTKEEAARQLVLPVVAEPERSAPTLWLRSSIFGVVGRGKREDRRMYELPTPWAQGKLYFTGIQLAQDDLDVLLQMLHLTSSHGGPGTPVHFSDRGMTKAIGRAYGTKTLQWLDEVAHRLMAAVIVLDNGEGQSAQFHLVRSYVRNASTGQRAFVVDPEVMHFFADSKYTVLQWEQRLALSTGLSKWLHGFLMSQPTTKNGIGLQLLKEMSGIAATRPLRKFKADLQAALDELTTLDDPHLGLQSAAIIDGKMGAKLVWSRRPDRIAALN